MKPGRFADGSVVFATLQQEGTRTTMKALGDWLNIWNRTFTVGTRSVLFGAHAFWLHPWFVAAAWMKLYGFPFDPRLWFAFFLHDIGYVFKPNMDGIEGETHPEVGAEIMSQLFDAGFPRWKLSYDEARGEWSDRTRAYGRWGTFSLLHSRYYAKTLGQQPSRLCIADKLAIALTPAWLYLPMVRATGEVHEYMAHAKHRIVGNVNITDEEKRRVVSTSQAEWYAGVQSYCRRWAQEHRDGKVDAWTSDPTNRATVDEHGTWR